LHVGKFLVISVSLEAFQCYDPRKGSENDVTKTEIVKVILFLVGAFACAMGVMDYIASTASPWRAAFWIIIFAVGFLAFIFFFCRVLALFMLRFETKADDDVRTAPLTQAGVTQGSVTQGGEMTHGGETRATFRKVD